MNEEKNEELDQNLSVETEENDQPESEIHLVSQEEAQEEAQLEASELEESAEALSEDDLPESAEAPSEDDLPESAEAPSEDDLPESAEALLGDDLPETELVEGLSEDDETEEIEDDEIILTGEPDFEVIEVAAAESKSDSSLNGTIEIEDNITATSEEIKPVIEALLFVADEPLPFKQLCKLLGEVIEENVKACLDELAADYVSRNSGLEVREIAGGWRISTRPQNHEFIRKYLKSRPSARLSLPALETLAVIAYKQPITIPEILEIRGVSSSSAIKTLLEKRLIVTKGRKETVGRPMMYGTSKEFLIQFGLKDLTELPSIEDFADLSQ